MIAKHFDGKLSTVEWDELRLDPGNLSIKTYPPDCFGRGGGNWSPWRKLTLSVLCFGKEECILRPDKHRCWYFDVFPGQTVTSMSVARQTTPQAPTWEPCCPSGKSWFKPVTSNPVLLWFWSSLPPPSERFTSTGKCVNVVNKACSLLKLTQVEF